MIILGKGWNEETLVHEFTHHLRHVDDTRGGLTRTPFGLNEHGERIDSRKIRTDEFNSMRNLEEASTVAESLVRIQAPSEGANGYYASTRAKGNTPMDRYNHDFELLSADKPQRGRKAERRVKDGFDDTAISHLGYYRPGNSAGKYFQKRKSEGTLPVPVKREKKARKASRSDVASAVGPSMVGAEAQKSANRRLYRPRK